MSQLHSTGSCLCHLLLEHSASHSPRPWPHTSPGPRSCKPGLRLRLPRTGAKLSKMIQGKSFTTVLSDPSASNAAVVSLMSSRASLRENTTSRGPSPPKPAWPAHAPGPQLPSAPSLPCGTVASVAQQRRKRIQGVLCHLQLLLAGRDFLALGLDQPFVGLQKLGIGNRASAQLPAFLSFSSCALASARSFSKPSSHGQNSCNSVRKHHNCSLRVERVPATTLVVSGAFCRKADLAMCTARHLERLPPPLTSLAFEGFLINSSTWQELQWLVLSLALQVPSRVASW